MYDLSLSGRKINIVIIVFVFWLLDKSNMINFPRKRHNPTKIFLFVSDLNKVENDPMAWLGNIVLDYFQPGYQGGAVVL